MGRYALALALLVTACVAARAAPPAAAQPVAAGPLPAHTMTRLLLVDGTRVGARAIAAGDRGYIVVSEDGGATWKRARAPTGPLLTALDFADTRNGWAVGHDTVVFVTSDGGESWTQQFSAPSEQRPLLDIATLSPLHSIAVGAYGAYYETTDGGATWNARKVVEDDKHFNAIVKLTNGRLVILGEAGTILTSANAGRTWSAVESPYKGSLFGGVAAADGAVIAFGMRGRIYRSADSGQSWELVRNKSLAPIMGGARLADGTLVLTGAAGTLLVSNDHGRSFAPLATGTTRTFSKAIPTSGGALLVLGEGAHEVRLPQRPAEARR